MQTTKAQLEAVQNPFLLDCLRRENVGELADALRQVFGNLLLGKLDDSKIEELAPSVIAGSAKSDQITAEAAKPVAHRRHGLTLLRDDTKVARAYALFDAKLADQAARDLWAHWEVNTPPGYVAQPVHLYRNARHLLVSQKFVRAKYGATSVQPADLPQQNDSR